MKIDIILVIQQLDYICKRDRQLEKEIKLIRDERIKAQYSELTQSQFVEVSLFFIRLCIYFCIIIKQIEAFISFRQTRL